MTLPGQRDTVSLAGSFLGEFFGDVFWWGLPWWGVGGGNKRAFAEERGRNIEDTFGISVGSIQEYQSRNGGRGILKGLVIGTLAALAGGSAALFFPPLMPAAVLIGISTGCAASALSVGIHESRIVKGYNMYLDEKAAQGRAIRESALRGVCNQSYEQADHGLGPPSCNKSRDHSL